MLVSVLSRIGRASPVDNFAGAGAAAATENSDGGRGKMALPKEQCRLNGMTKGRMKRCSVCHELVDPSQHKKAAPTGAGDGFCNE